MNSKERVRKTFKHEKTDRVPINYFANGDIDRRLKEHFGLAINDNDGLLEKLGVDFRGINAPYKGKPLFDRTGVPDDVSVDPVWGIRTKWVKHESGGYQDFCDFPLKDATLEDIENWPMPNPDDYDYTYVKTLTEKYKDYALHVGNPGLGDNMNSLGMIFGTERVYMALALDDEAVLRYMDRRKEIMVEIARRTIEAANGQIDFIWLGEDLGTQRGALISLDTFRKHIRPKLQSFVDLAKEYNLPVLIHSCGSSSWAFNDFLEMGITAVDTLQPEAKNMSPEYLLKTFGDKFCYHGCISTAGPLAYGTVDEVSDYCKKTLDTMMPYGGYMFSPTHSIQDNSPTENVLKMYEVGKDYGRYDE